jgi:hypothetical protein
MATHPMHHCCWICGKEVSLENCKTDSTAELCTTPAYLLG